MAGKKLNKSSRCGMARAAMQRGDRHRLVTSKVSESVLFQVIPRPLGIISWRPCPRVRLRRHATQRARDARRYSSCHSEPESDLARRGRGGLLSRAAGPGGGTGTPSQSAAAAGGRLRVRLTGAALSSPRLWKAAAAAAAPRPPPRLTGTEPESHWHAAGAHWHWQNALRTA